MDKVWLSSGSRPKISMAGWSMARVNSFLRGSRKHDTDLRRKKEMSINHIISLPLGMAIKRGMINNFSGIQKFGYNPTVGTSFETIWDVLIFILILLLQVQQLQHHLTSSDDNGGTVEIQGLDTNYDLATETLTIGGSASTTSFIRVFRAVLKTR